MKRLNLPPALSPQHSELSTERTMRFALSALTSAVKGQVPICDNLCKSVAEKLKDI